MKCSAKMKILITGANGLVGKNFLEEMNSKNVEIMATSKDNESLAAFIKKNQLKNIKVKKLDVLKPNDCNSVIKDFDVVLHLAANIDVQLSLRNPKKVIDVNYNGTLNVLESIRQNNVSKMIFLSTQDIYGNNINSREDELEKITASNPYSLSKLICEETIQMYSRLYKINYIILRPSRLYGQFQDKGIIPTLIERVMKCKVIEIGNNVKRDFLNVNDLVKAIELLLHYKKNNVFNIGTGESTSIKELINIIAESMNKKIKIITNKKLIRNPSIERWNELANIEKITKLGWKPKQDLRTWVHEHVIPLH